MASTSAGKSSPGPSRFSAAAVASGPHASHGALSAVPHATLTFDSSRRRYSSSPDASSALVVFALAMRPCSSGSPRDSSAALAASSRPADPRSMRQPARRCDANAASRSRASTRYAASTSSFSTSNSAMRTRHACTRARW
eukprot:350783-Chlamydomonas_euryale.AAC.6